jgi:hypothetical protein
MFLRTFNALHVQAPYVKPADHFAFMSLAACLLKAIHHHHEGEEQHIFPGIERLSGQTGIMEANVAQHRAFDKTFEALQVYVDDFLAKKQEYDGAKLRKLLDEFGPVFREHLADEIETLEALREYGVETMKPLPKIFEDSVKDSMPKTGVWTGKLMI